MTIQTILIPVFIEVALIYVLLGLTVVSRRAAFAAGLSHREVALNRDAFPARSRQFANAYANQFEIPVLFIAAVILALVVHQAGTLFAVFEWLFVVARVAHAFVYATSNVVAIRGGCFALSAFCTGALWILIALGVFGLA